MVGRWTPKKLGDFCLCQPNIFIMQKNLYFYFAVCRSVEQKLGEAVIDEDFFVIFFHIFIDVNLVCFQEAIPKAV